MTDNTKYFFEGGLRLGVPGSSASENVSEAAAVEGVVMPRNVRFDFAQMAKAMNEAMAKRMRTTIDMSADGEISQVSRFYPGGPQDTKFHCSRDVTNRAAESPFRAAQSSGYKGADSRAYTRHEYPANFSGGFHGRHVSDLCTDTSGSMSGENAPKSPLRKNLEDILSRLAQKDGFKP